MSELERRMLEYRSKTDYRLLKEQPVIVMVDGHSFSKLIKNKYKKPFDPEFINLMNKTAEQSISEIQNCKFAYVQSDEISFFIDSRKDEVAPYFDYRLCKLQSIIASKVTKIFNDLKPKCLCEFDCKAWNVPTDNDVYAHFLWRQNDCIRNSISQAAQTYIPENELLNLNIDQQLEKLLIQKGIDWNSYDPGMKYGRFVWKDYVEYVSPKWGPYTRSVYEAKPAWLLREPEGRDKFMKLLKLEKYEEN